MNRNTRRCCLSLLAVILTGVSGLAQYGSSPRSTYPGRSGRSGTGLPPPVPEIGSNSKKDKSAGAPLPAFSGVLKGLGGKTLTVAEGEENVLQFRCSKKTAYYDGAKTIKRSALKPGDSVTVEAKRAPDGSLDAVNVRLEHAEPTADEPARDVTAGPNP